MASKRIPQTVRFALIWLGVFASVLLLTGLALADFVLVLGAGVTALLLWALSGAQRWAYVLTLGGFLAAAIVLVVENMPVQGAAVFVVGGLVWVPLVMSREWYFPPRRRYGPA